MRLSRTMLLPVACLLAACGAVDQAVDDAQTAVDNAVEEATSAIEGVATTEPTGNAPASPAGNDPAAPAATDPPAPTGSTPTATAPPASDPTSAPPPPALTAVDDTGGVGVNGPAILRGDRPRLVVEVDVQTGASVDQAALDNLLATAASVSDKTDIGFADGNEFASDDTSWSRQDLAAAAAANRTTTSTGDQVSLHLLVVRGVHERDGQETNAIGLAYSASTIAYFPERVGGLSGLTGGGTGIARAVLVHELGHVLGLVNLTYTSPIDHEDPDNPGHSRSQDSVMFHAVETTLVTELFGGGPPDSFDSDDLADLEGLRTGRLGPG